MSSKIDYKEINKLIRLMEEKNLSHFELEVEGLKIKIGRDLASAFASEPAPALETSKGPETKANNTPLEAAPQEGKNDLYYITSPMVGTFYSAPDPSSSPFVEIGDPVKKNQTLCIIEAMKLMNEIESEVDGTLKKIFVENGKPVEYGQRLFAIQPLS
ncbi:MAG: acetyl-CoA carboxylase biotin carboxyl carrier protein [Candidatus Aminicenantes bacterium]|jgi:acetyl-CoA carboxylase biotin carboxyl carrier protein|nr:MAG: acetyl-CoA carboxylase biotin carboxyl carrier protein [Candidatus Aminicenantes bacterium]